MIPMFVSVQNVAHLVLRKVFEKTFQNYLWISRINKEQRIRRIGLEDVGIIVLEKRNCKDAIERFN